jgi:hypothetical protein
MLESFDNQPQFATEYLADEPLVIPALPMAYAVGPRRR